ncbi:MAG: DNA polymerase III subunit alpha [Bryobacterales bacterium]|nr:DNA polymerase III subunit alpha [Bryobacterales bacterium]
MPVVPYLELRTRSAFSFLEGGSTPEDLVTEAARLGFPALALIDRDGLYGAPRFHMAARKAGLRAHIGAEVTCTDGHRYPLLAATRTGYQNLCRLITRMKLRAPKMPARQSDPRAAVRRDEIAELSDGLLALDPHLVDIFGPTRTYAELQRHFDRHREWRNQTTVDFARRHNIPLLATNGVHYASPARREITDALTCLRHHTTLAAAGRLLDRNTERYLKPPAEMARLFADFPDAVRNTLALSERLEFSLSDLGYEFPRYPDASATPDTMNRILREAAGAGARRRYVPYHDKARAQIERELALIEKLELAGYFLIVWDIVNFCRDHNILVQGRGSAANSAVCYSLGITAVDPVGMELLFERFLSEERGEWPDIDLDLPSGDQRERAIQHIYAKYGERGAAMTANVITYRGRSAAREMGKVLGLDAELCARLASLIPQWGYQGEEETPETHFREALRRVKIHNHPREVAGETYSPPLNGAEPDAAALDGIDFDHPRIRKFFELYKAVLDLPRHLGQHSGGMVICQGRLDAVVPLEPASMPGRVVVQWDKEDCADMGIIKVDLLGLGMMAVLEDSLALSRRVYSTEIDLAHLPADDPAVYDALCQADTIGMFQVESRAQMSSLPRVEPRNFYDLVVQVALIRPGPIVGKMVHPYMRRRRGQEPAECLHPSLEPVLRRTLGVPLFQEQLLRMAMIVANFTGGEAEELRRAMGFKRSEQRMADIETRLRAGMAQNGITGEQQDVIVKSITSFALYGFPESHAASFALIAYASAYLKTHFPAIFTAALLNNQPMGFYHPATIVKDAQRHGVRMLPVDVAISEWLCEPLGERSKPTVRLGLRYARGVSEASGRAIVARRPFTSIDDLTRRVPEVRKDELRRLASIGALNSLEAAASLHRRHALWEVERAARPAGPLFAYDQPSTASPLAPMSPSERLFHDFLGTGLTVGRHLMAHRRAEFAADVLRATDLAAARHNRWVKIAGCVIVRQRPGTAKGFVFLSLEDETGVANIIVEPDVFERERDVIVNSPVLLIEGPVQHLEGTVHVRARRVRAVPSGVAVASHDFH